MSGHLESLGLNMKKNMLIIYTLFGITVCSISTEASEINGSLFREKNVQGATSGGVNELFNFI